MTTDRQIPDVVRDPGGLDSTWGFVTPGQNYVITPSGFKESPGPGEGAGITVSPFTFEISGPPGAHVTVTLTLPDAFIANDTAGLLPLSSWWAYVYADDWPPWTVGPEFGDSVTVSIGDSGVAVLSLAAMVTVPITAVPGPYTAQLTISYPGSLLTNAPVGEHGAVRSVVTGTIV